MFTDGAFRKSRRRARGRSAGCGIYVPEYDVELSVALFEHDDDEESTSQRAELGAILYAFHLLVAHKKDWLNDGMRRVMLKTDSEYSYKCLTSYMMGWKRRGWRTALGEFPKNMDLLYPLFCLYNSLPHLHVMHVPREQNSKADELAGLGASALRPALEWHLFARNVFHNEMTSSAGSQPSHVLVPRILQKTNTGIVFDDGGEKNNNNNNNQQEDQEQEAQPQVPPPPAIGLWQGRISFARRIQN